MLDRASEGRSGEDGYVEFATTGTAVAGAYHCSSCGYGVTLNTVLPVCPMCAGTTWEPQAWTTAGGPYTPKSV